MEVQIAIKVEIDVAKVIAALTSLALTIVYIIQYL
jgi:hypothetical protein